MMDICESWSGQSTQWVFQDGSVLDMHNTCSKVSHEPSLVPQRNLENLTSYGPFTTSFHLHLHLPSRGPDIPQHLSALHEARLSRPNNSCVIVSPESGTSPTSVKSKKQKEQNSEKGKRALQKRTTDLNSSPAQDPWSRTSHRTKTPNICIRYRSKRPN